ncbi:MAG: type II toxin-antitoxin system HicB family antitoxin [Thiocapsa sp.]|uniref:type II toxin-antitoxin system HicB family antitoxin n=1 Tax=Thiocapsa sp. TaxID=2024551 RepID=UPI001BCC1F6A|nr:type II toxin-antitoxin system HicB family antitoxin [Thiocapsa sp.]QVL50710.1 MAG: type II toxin-antitoxin system HicB family antitoxin [Thiocapsa sp.]
MKLKVIVHEAEEGGYWAEVPAIPGCATQGETFEELLTNLYDAVESCLAVDLTDISTSATGLGLWTLCQTLSSGAGNWRDLERPVGSWGAVCAVRLAGRVRRVVIGGGAGLTAGESTASRRSRGWTANRGGHGL